MSGDEQQRISPKAIFGMGTKIRRSHGEKNIRLRQIRLAETRRGGQVSKGAARSIKKRAGQQGAAGRCQGFMIRHGERERGRETD